MSVRKRIVVDPTVQWAVARRVASHWMSFFALLLGVNISLRLLLTLSEDSFISSAWQALVAQMPLICVMLLVLPIFTRDTLRMSNRFAGPMHRLRISLDALAESDTSEPLQFRSGDFWQEVALKFNRVRDRVADLESRNRKLEHDLRRLSAAAPHEEQIAAL